MVDIILWFLLLELLALSVLPLVSRALPWAPDGGMGVSFIAGPLLLAVALWHLTLLGITSAARSGLVPTVAAILLIGLLLYRRSGGARAIIAGRRQDFITAHAVFFCVAAGFLLVRSYSPEIQFGEKPMDFSFLNFFTRLETLPPQDPWASGQAMYYYYLGFFMTALLLKMTGIDPAIGYNLAVATFPSFFAAAAYSCLRQVITRRLPAIYAALAVLLFGNLAVFKLWIIDGQPLDSHLFWASTRVFRSPGFSEYPVWTFLFADLHPHMMALPVTMALAALGIGLLDPGNKLRVWSVLVHRLLYAVLWGSLVVLNAWDFVSWGLVTGLLLLLRPWKGQLGVGRVLLELIRRGLELLLLTAAALLTASPFFSGRPAGGAPLPFLAERGEFNNLLNVLLMHGIWAVPLAAVAVTLIVRLRPVHSAAAVMLAAAVPLALGAGSAWAGTRGIPWTILAFGSMVLAFALLFPRAGSRTSQAASAWAAGGILLIVLFEIVVLIDRMNSIFKFHTAAFIMLALAWAAAVQEPRTIGPVLQVAEKKLRSGGTALKLLFTVTAVLGATSGILIAGIVIVTDPHWTIRGPRPTLNGIRYLDIVEPDEALIIRWIRENVSGVPVVLEAFGPSYQRFTRIANNTGLRTVLGWEHHVGQRGTPQDEIKRRARDIQTIYTTEQAAYAEKLLRNYGVSLIVVGKLERERYPGAGMEKFAENPHLFPLLVSSGDVSLYGTRKWRKRNGEQPG